MTTLTEVEDLYYAALRNARCLDWGIRQEDQESSSSVGYPIEKFQQWARRVDIYKLDKAAADFSRHEDIVKHFGVYRREVGSQLARSFMYKSLQRIHLSGELKDIGSCWDGSKVAHLNEIDSLYVMRNQQSIVRPAGKPGCYRVYLTEDSPKHEVTPRVIRDQFADLLCHLISRQKLPPCLRHGGYNSSRYSHHLGDRCVTEGPGILSPHPLREGRDSSRDVHAGYSGVRYNGPAVTSQFIAQDDSLLTWDVTPVFSFPDAEGAEISQALRDNLKPIRDANPNKLFPYREIHLVPDVVDDLWRVTSAKPEADTLRDLSQEAPLKKALSITKALSSELTHWNDDNILSCRLSCLKSLSFLPSFLPPFLFSFLPSFLCNYGALQTFVKLLIINNFGRLYR